MAVFNGAFPVLPGKEDAGRAFAKATMGEWRSGYEDSQNRAGITRETWSLQELPDGTSVVLVWFECPNIEKVFSDIAQEDTDFAVWFRGQVKDITGVDMTELPEGAPEVMLDWRLRRTEAFRARLVPRDLKLET